MVDDLSLSCNCQKRRERRERGEEREERGGFESRTTKILRSSSSSRLEIVTIDRSTRSFFFSSSHSLSHLKEKEEETSFFNLLR